MELLNLDELVDMERRVTIRGESYAVVERSVGVMLDALKVAKASKAKSSNEEVFLDNMIRTIQTIVPDAPEQIIRSLNMRQMAAILEFCAQNPQAMADQAVAEGKAAGKSGQVESVVEVPDAGEQ